MLTKKLTTEILTAAIDGFEAQKLNINAQIAELRAMLSGDSTQPTTAPGAPKGKRRKMSAAARKRIGDAQRKRWAESKKAAEPSAPATTPEGPKKKRKMSAAGRQAIAEATKKRWATFHAAKKAAAKASVAKKSAPKKKGSPKKNAKAPAAIAAQ
jgi:hypothetical protein